MNSTIFPIILCMPFLVQAMDSPIFDKPDSIAIERYNDVRIINIAKVQEIAGLGNNQLVVKESYKRPCLINLDSQKCSYFQYSFIPFKCHLTTDQPKKRVLFSRQDDLVKIAMYDSVLNQFVSNEQLNCNDDLGDKYFPIYFNEHKPTSLLMSKGYPSPFDEHKPTFLSISKGYPSPIVSYNYNTREISPESCLSDGYKDSSMLNFQYIYNPHSKVKGIIGQCTDGFKIYYDSPSSIDRQIKKYDAIPAGRQRSYMYAPDLSFIVYHALFHRIFELSELPQGFRCEYGVDNGCYISYANGDKTTSALEGNGHVSIPCSMAMHPVNNKVFAVMLAGSRIIHYFNSQGIFLAEQNLPTPDPGNFDTELETSSKYLDFLNGELLAAVYPNKIGIFNVPFHVQCGITTNELILTWWYLRNYQLDGNILPKDIVKLLLYSLKYS